MSNIKVTYLFEHVTQQKGNNVTGSRESGWGESFVGNYTSVTDPNIPQDVARILIPRMPLLANQAKFTGFRAHDLSTNATRAYPYNFASYGTGGDCTLPQVALILRLFAANTVNNRALELRGLPGAAVTTGEADPTFLTYAKVSAFGRAILSTYGMLGVNKTFKHFKVDNVSATGLVTLNETGVGFAANQTVQFYRTKFDATCCGGVGQYNVTSFDGNRALQLSNWPAGKTAHGGKVAQWTIPAFLAFDQTSGTKGGLNGLAIERVVMRKTGRPFDLFSGRRSKRCCQC